MRPLVLLIGLPWLLAACATGKATDSDPRAADARRADRRGQLDEALAEDLPARDRGPTPDLRPSADTRATVDAPWPVDKRLPDTGPRVLFSYDFEAGNGGLTGSLDWQWGVPAFKPGPDCEDDAAPPSACHSGTHCWGTLLDDCYTPRGNDADSCSNQDPADDSILKLTFQIPPDYKSAKLVYWEWTDFNTPYDWAEIRVNGQVATQTCTGYYSPPSSWEQRSLDLAAWIGKAVTVEFHFMASTVVNYSGWYLDDLSLRE